MVKISSTVKKILACGLVAYSAATLPLVFATVANNHLRTTFQETWAHWLCRYFGAQAVFCGDSIMAGGGHWLAPGQMLPIGFLTRNLAGNGYTTYQVQSQIETALRDYKPKTLYVFCGVNDAFAISAGRLTLEQSTLDFKELLSTGGESVIVTLPTPVQNPDVNSILIDIRDQYRQVADEMNIPVVDISPLLSDTDGRLSQRFTNDGVHLAPEAYEIWIKELGRTLRK
jgi:lysophospholipase L1-like esterase